MLSRLIVATLLIGGSAVPAAGAGWDAMLPARCTGAPIVAGDAYRNARSTAEALPGTIDGAALQRAAERLASERGLLLRDAQLEIARFSAARAGNAGEARAILDLLRRLWTAGHPGAALDYGKLAAKWPELQSRPGAEQAFLSAAMEGSAEAFLALARLRTTASGAAGSADRLVEQARSLLWMQVSGGDCRALLVLARLELAPIGAERRPAVAADLLNAAVERRVTGAAVKLADLYLGGDGVPYDAAQAVKVLGMASAWGERAALLALARLYFAGPLPVRDRKRAEAAAATLAQAAGEPPASLRILLAEDAAGHFGAPVEPERAAALLAAAAEEGPGEHDLELAEAYLEGWGGTVDIPAASRILAAAAQAGNPEALRQLGELHLASDGPTFEALRLLREAAAAGHVPAMERLLALAAAGSAPDQDAERATTLLERAAEDGSDAAALVLARSALRDAIRLHRPPDLEKTERMLRRAAGAGNIVAALDLARMVRMVPGTEDRQRQARDLLDSAITPGSGSPKRMLELGRAYVASTGPDAQSGGAAELFRKCAALGEVRCHAELGSLAADPAEAERGREIAAQAGDARALYALANGDRPVETLLLAAAERGFMPAMLAMIEVARSDPFRLGEAMLWFDRARAFAGAHIEDLAALGSAYRDGRHLPRDTDLALQWLLRAARAGSVAAMRDAGSLQLRHPEAEVRRAGEEWLVRAASLGDVAAMERLSEACYRGQFGTAEPARGFDYALLAAYRGSVAAMRSVANALDEGIGTAADPDAATSWRLEAAGAGNAAAMEELARANLSSPDPDERAAAVAWLRRGAEKGDGRALFRLGRLHQEGRVLAKDLNAAETFYRAAADAGDVPSMLALSRLRDQSRGAAPRADRINENR